MISASDDHPDLSLVIPLYDEEECISEFIRQVRSSIDLLPFSYEIIFVDDGSQDRTVEIVIDFCKSDPRIALIQLTRNYGKEAALTAGITHASGAFILMMDPDLQDPPERIVDFYNKIREGYDLVFSTRIEKSDSLIRKLTSKIFWSTLNTVTGLNIPPNLGAMRIFSQAFAQEFLRYPERVRFIEGLFMSIGMRRTTIEIENRPRFAGVSKFTLKRRIKLATNAMLAFSDLPLRFTMSLGLAGVLASIFFGLIIVFRKAIFGIGLLGWTSTVTIIIFFGSLQLFVLGLIGNYIGRIYTEIKARPVYSIYHTFNLKQDQGSEHVDASGQG
ncbi:glycosyltransferase family 2 protein [uncultured Gimesia sp.]|jgi:polyisoprenyl-phosphate glycosyltransferase|uniref:glycosyltransferase family 2 protein n=1 Tax=uncultured Gimesia sp. TaxID=1678688 RepID=UPI0026162CA8|nr:glycosyltransferase family 2 protein [uncultured Gimesia sp.]